MTVFCRLKALALGVLAHLGNARAQYVLAGMYYQGECVERNAPKAAAWSLRAAKQGLSRAQLLFSNLSLAGFGVPADLGVAFHWAEQAALANDPNGWHSLAWFHAQGAGTAVNKERAFELWLKAAEAGVPISQYSVAYCLTNGSGTARNLQAAVTWMELAFANGLDDPEAIALYQSVRQELGSSPTSAARFARREIDETPVRDESRWQLYVRTLLTTLRWLLDRDDFSYHLRQSRLYEQGGLYEAAARHARKALELADDAETRARLAHCYVMIGNNADAVREYRKAVVHWEHPAIMLGLAQAEFRSGNVDTARDLLRKVQTSYMREHLRHAIAELKREMGESA